MGTRRIARGVTAVLVVSAAMIAEASTPSPASAARADAPGSDVDIGGRKIYVRCSGPRVAGEATIVLVSGYHDSSDVWTQSDLWRRMRWWRWPRVHHTSSPPAVITTSNSRNPI
jgi:hypothetical protein